jgi:hypothetical protein
MRTMRKVRNITVAVKPEIYRQTRQIATDYNTTVTDMIRFLLLALPDAVKAARYPGGRPQFELAAARADRAAASAPPAATPPNPPSPSPEKILPCTPVNASQPHSPQQLATQKPTPVQDEYTCKSTLKSIIFKGFTIYSVNRPFPRCTPVKPVSTD